MRIPLVCTVGWGDPVPGAAPAVVVVAKVVLLVDDVVVEVG